MEQGGRSPATLGGRFRPHRHAAARCLRPRLCRHASSASIAWLQEGVLRRLGVIVVLIGVSVGRQLLADAEGRVPAARQSQPGDRHPAAAAGLQPRPADGRWARRSRTVCKPYWDVDPGFARKPRSCPIPVIGDFFYVARGRQLFMGVRAPIRCGPASWRDWCAKWPASMPGTIAIAKQTSLFEQGLTAGRTIDVEITGPEIEQLVGLGGAMMGQVMQKIPGAPGPARAQPRSDQSRRCTSFPSGSRRPTCGVSAPTWATRSMPWSTAPTPATTTWTATRST